MIFNELENFVLFLDLFLTFHKNVQGKNNIAVLL